MAFKFNCFVFLLVDCTSLRDALLSAKIEGQFLCLSGGEIFPVAAKEKTNEIPSKLLVRDFHKELRLIIQELRKRREKETKVKKNGGAIFYGPSGIGKSWSSMAILVDELKDAVGDDGSVKKSVVYFDATGQRAFVFGKNRNVRLNGLTNGPNERDVPELLERDTFFIYDAARGAQSPLPAFCCETYIFSSPNAGNFKQAADSGALIRFICPSWSKEELIALEHGYGDIISKSEVEKLYEECGGSPRAVVANPDELTHSRIADAKILLRGVKLWFILSGTDPSWPSSLLKAAYKSTSQLAVTPSEAYEKYIEHNVGWDYSCARAKEIVYEEYKRVSEIEKSAFATWLKNEPKAKTLYGYHFEYEAEEIFGNCQAQDVEFKVLLKNDGLSDEQQQNLDQILEDAKRDLRWTFPAIKKVVNKSMELDNKISELSKLKDSTVIYRLPADFPLIDFFNPPNNCFSLGVGDHTIKLDAALELCNTLQQSKQINFIYTTPSANYFNVQRFQSFQKGNNTKTLGKLPTGDIKRLSRLVQFCMRFKRI